MDQPSPQAKFLKEAREKKGVSLEAVHEGTKIPMDVLKAIEEGYKIRTLSPFYYKGFLKMYAHYLGVDVSSLSGETKEDNVSPVKVSAPVKVLPQVLPSSEKSKFNPSPNPVYRTSIRNLPKPSETTEKREFVIKMIVGAVGVFIVCFLLFKMVAFFVKKVPLRRSDAIKVEKNIREQAEKSRKDKAQKVKSESVSKPNKEAASSEAPTASLAAANAPAATGSLTKTGKKISLTVRAKKNTWLQVKADKETVFQSTLKKGMAETWVANESIEISGGNINQLELELNGKMLGSLGREEQSANKIVITKDGLSVKK